VIDAENVTAYIEGYSARKEMFARTQHGETRVNPDSVVDEVGLNPYPLGTEAHASWAHGYKDAWNPETVTF
jgi:hypothetical protein